jgi:hypothetical protein
MCLSKVKKETLMIWRWKFVSAKGQFRKVLWLWRFPEKTDTFWKLFRTLARLGLLLHMERKVISIGIKREAVDIFFCFFALDERQTKTSFKQALTNDRQRNLTFHLIRNSILWIFKSVEIILSLEMDQKFSQISEFLSRTSDVPNEP